MRVSIIGVLLTVCAAGTSFAQQSDCDKSCLEAIGDRYRAAYVKHDPKLAPIAKNVRFTENNVELEFPDASWDTVTQEIGPALTLSDAKTMQVGIFTSVMQRDTQGYLAVRLKIDGGQITEIEHILSTRRNLSAPPTPFGNVHEFKRDPDLARQVAASERMPREKLIAHANGYFSTLENNTGEIRGTRISPEATRFENGMRFPDIEKGFKSGRYRFNNRVRDRDYFLVDEERGIVMSRAFIDHKGVLDEFTLTDGNKARSIFREPQTWSVLELFKIKNDMITAVEATFIGAPYYIRSPWTKRPDPKYDAHAAR
jgi:hypothetical protein